MPRKQRFKPSRKPKPIPQNEDALIGRQPSSAPSGNDNRADNENIGVRDTPDVRGDDSLVEPDSGQQSR
jgi:hypothetical protein